MLNDEAQLTAIYTLVGGVTLFGVSTWVTEGFAKPLRSFKHLLNKVDFTLIYRAEVISSLQYHQNPELCTKASIELRELAASLHSQLRELYLHDELTALCILPSKAQITCAISELIGLSNKIYASDNLSERTDASNAIREHLKLERFV